MTQINTNSNLQTSFDTTLLRNKKTNEVITAQEFEDRSTYKKYKYPVAAAFGIATGISSGLSDKKHMPKEKLTKHVAKTTLITTGAMLALTFMIDALKFGDKREGRIKPQDYQKIYEKKGFEIIG